jgi:hypothetical protein
MNTLKKIAVLAATSGLLAAAAVTPSSARSPVPAPSDYYAYWNPGAPAHSIYEQPDGSYKSYTDFSRDLNGVPCGMECRADHLMGR